MSRLGSSPHILQSLESINCQGCPWTTLQSNSWR